MHQRWQSAQVDSVLSRGLCLRDWGTLFVLPSGPEGCPWGSNAQTPPGPAVSVMQSSSLFTPSQHSPQSNDRGGTQSASPSLNCENKPRQGLHYPPQTTGGQAWSQAEDTWLCVLSQGLCSRPALPLTWKEAPQVGGWHGVAGHRTASKRGAGRPRG